MPGHNAAHLQHQRYPQADQSYSYGLPGAFESSYRQGQGQSAEMPYLPRGHLPPGAPFDIRGQRYDSPLAAPYASYGNQPTNGLTYCPDSHVAAPIYSSEPPPYWQGANVGEAYPRSVSRTHATASTPQQASSSYSLRSDMKLVAIPATSPALGSPFMRAYPPVLESAGVSREVFLQFLDHLNRVAVASPPVQVLGLAGNIAGLVPLHTAQIVGNAVNMAAKVTTVAMSKGRTEMLLRESNETIFGPCGLNVQVAKLEVVAQLAQIPILDELGKVAKNSTILAPFSDDEHSTTVSSQERRVVALSPWISPLDIVSLPAVDMPDNAFSKMHAVVSEKQRKKEEEKMQQDRKKMQKKWADCQENSRELEEKMQRYALEEEAIREKGGRRMNKEVCELERKRERATKRHDEEAEKLEKSRRRSDKEEGSMRKILFLVVRRV